MIRNAKDDCLEFDAAAFAEDAARIAGGGHFLPNEVGRMFGYTVTPTEMG